MTIYQFLCLIGFPSLLLAFCKYITNKIKISDKKSEATRNGVQALLRDRLHQSYEHFSSLEYAPIYAKENFENMYKQYQTIANDEVMKGIYEKFMLLSNERKEGE